jgi:hypothetical protein
MGLLPEFWMSVRGMTSIASATALYGHCATPSISLPLLSSPTAIAISVAPPPGHSLEFHITFLATPIASCRFRSISLRMSFEGPRSRMVQALGFLHSVRKVKYSSPILEISNRPHCVPMSDSAAAKTELTMVAPVARATRLLSVLRTRRMAVMLCLTRKC